MHDFTVYMKEVVLVYKLLEASNTKYRKDVNSPRREIVASVNGTRLFVITSLPQQVDCYRLPLLKAAWGGNNGRSTMGKAYTPLGRPRLPQSRPIGKGGGPLLVLFSKSGVGVMDYRC